MDIRFKGFEDVERNLSRLVDRLGAAATKGVEDSALDLLGRAVRDAPVDTGDLRGSGSVTFDGQVIAQGRKDGSITVTGSARPSRTPTAEIGFGVPYAYRQDQDREYRHPRGGKAGYLSDNFRTRGQRYLRHIENEARKVLGGS